MIHQQKRAVILSKHVTGGRSSVFLAQHLFDVERAIFCSWAYTRSGVPKSDFRIAKPRAQLYFNMKAAEGSQDRRAESRRRQLRGIPSGIFVIGR